MTSTPRAPRMIRNEAGAATIEYTGMTAAAAVLVLSLLLALATGIPVVEGLVRWAFCKVTTLGQGSCGTPTTAAQHVPTEPCVVKSESRSLRTEVEIVVVTAASGRRFEVAKLSDGSYRVTQIKSESVGLETGVGGGVTLTVNDRTVGGNAKAEAGAALDIHDGEVWYTRDPRVVQRMVNEDNEDAIESAVLGDGGPARWLWERGQDGVGAVTGHGDYEFPDADETYVEGGLRADAMAEVTGAGDHAGASIATARLLGRRTTRNGDTTLYFKSNVEGAVGLQRHTDGREFTGGQASGKVELITAATYDAGGVMREVSVTALAEGEAKGAVTSLFGGSGDSSLGNSKSGAVVYQAILPIRDDVDRGVATDFLVASGIREVAGPALIPATVPATARFIDAAAERGYTTRQTFDSENTTVLAADVEAKLGIEFGAGVSVDTAERTSNGAEYWDGTAWVARRECI